MCGIAGMFGRPDRAAVERMAAAMVHRGPDDDGFYVDDRVALGFRRLSIIDVAGGHQPLTNEDGSIVLVMNGEIYNHVELRRGLEARGHTLRTKSDGEVILHLYEEQGLSVVESLNGIFAFALWDSRSGQLLLVRDHHGVKPLCYARVGGRLLFASEMKAMIASGAISRELSSEAVSQYLVYQVAPPPLSILKDIEQLPPGAMLVAREGDVRVRTYWTPPLESRTPVTDVEDAKEIVIDGLKDAVRRQMMSERPLGVFLSGGVDSSALVALASEHVSHPLKTFSVGFTGPDEEVLTEWPWARIVAERYGTEHEEVVLTERMFHDAMPHTFSAMDQPTSDAINSYWVSWAASKHVVVALSGTGGDELFLGYGRDQQLLARYEQASSLAALPGAYVRTIARLLGHTAGSALRQSTLDRINAVRAFALLDDEFVSPNGMGIVAESECGALLSPDFRSPGGASRGASFLDADVPSNLRRPGDWLGRLEQRGYLSYVLLRDIDAMSMAHSLEVRVPFLDPRYTEAVARIPWEMKLRDGCGKWILKQALKPYLPDEVLFRPKMGFGLPYPVWMRRSLQPMVRDLMSPSRLRRRGVFDVTNALQLVNRFYAGDDTVWRRVWTLFVLEGWATQVLDASQEVKQEVNDARAA
jgi:asparagine synthase (glutamine-hydrolysing)